MDLTWANYLEVVIGSDTFLDGLYANSGILQYIFIVASNDLGKICNLFLTLSIYLLLSPFNSELDVLAHLFAVLHNN